MMNGNIMIGTAILATYSHKKHKDSIDLMIPFVKYALQEKYQVGDIVSTSDINAYIQEHFAFYELPRAIIEKSLNRLSKNNGCLAYNNRKLYFKKEVSDEHMQIKNRKQQAMVMIDSIVQKLTIYINGKNLIKKYSEEEVKRALFAFLDRYGLTAYQNELDEGSFSRFEPLNRTIGSFILEEYESKSNIFDNIIELIKGVFLSKAIYLQNDNDSLFKTKMKDVVIILDAPLLLKILGLKTEGENRVAKEFLSLVPPQVRLKYFDLNFIELENIIRTYRDQKKSGGNFGQTLEYFDENNYSVESIGDYCIQLEKKLRDLNITEYVEDLPINAEYFIDEEGLKQYLRGKIPSYKNKEKALENDVDTISRISRLRKGKRPTTIENCKAIFITSNYKLVLHANNYLGDIQTIGRVMSETDFTILMWLKNRNNASIPKDILVANALAATEEITESFMTGVLDKIKEFEIEGGLDYENVGLILENIFYQRELLEKCNGIPEQLTIKDVQNLQSKYDQEVVKKAGLDLEKANKDLEQMRSEANQDKKRREEAENRAITLEQKIKTLAKEKASKKSKIIGRLIKFSAYIFFIILLIVGIVACVYEGIKGDISVWGIIVLVFGVLGVFDCLISKFRYIIKFSNVIQHKVYNTVYDKNIKVLSESNK